MATLRSGLNGSNIHMDLVALKRKISFPLLITVNVCQIDVFGKFIQKENDFISPFCSDSMNQYLLWEWQSIPTGIDVEGHVEEGDQLPALDRD